MMKECVVCKTCRKCNETKPISEFHNDKYSKDGKTTRCATCRKEATRKHWREVAKPNRTKHTHTCKSCNEVFVTHNISSVFCNPICKENWWKGEEGNKYRADRKRKGPFELTCEVCKKTFIHAKSTKKTCGEECHRVRRRPYDAKHKRESRPAMKADETSWYWKPINVIRRRIGKGLRDSLNSRNGTIAKNNTTFELLPYTKEELVSHLESRLTDGMSWDNMSEWHIDHIRPVASFNFDSTEHPDFKKCWALNNLQPLWAADNIRKGDKWDGIINR